MTPALAGLLALSAALHAAIILRYGLKGNAPPAAFGALYLVLAVAVWTGVSFALWATLAVVLVGSAGLLANYRKISHEKTLEHAILALNLLVLVITALQLRA
ncbi:MAG: hypothetical protein ACT4N9_06025 [Paracoccaceae bacterium]